MTAGRAGPGHLARYLRQRKELSGPEVFLDELTKSEALRLSAERPTGASTAASNVPSPPASSTASPPDGSNTDQLPLSADYESLREQALSCKKCELAGTRTNVVFSDGNPRARLMVVGEAPGAQEDKTGRAFVGPAGKLLDLLLASVGLSRATSVYICNVLKCRPPGNRNPLPGEIQACTPYLRQQIELISPQAILAVGTFAAQFLTTLESPMGKLRGEVYSYQGVPLVVTYHPAALLRNSGWTRATWDDLQLLRKVIDGA